MVMPGRSFNSGDYRYGVNGKEKDDEIKGSENSLDFGARIYDPRLGRWMSGDFASSMYPYHTPYCFVANNPMIYKEVDGNFFGLIIGGIIGGVGNAIVAACNGEDVFAAAVKGAAVGAMAGAVFDVVYTGGTSLLIAGGIDALSAGAASTLVAGGASGAAAYGYGSALEGKKTTASGYLDAVTFGAGTAGIGYGLQRIMPGIASWYAGRNSHGQVAEIEAQLLLAEDYEGNLAFIRGDVGAKRNQNVAYIEGEINGESYYSVGVSGTGKNTPVGTAAAPATRVFSTMIVGYDRLFDSEVKILEEFALKYNTTGETHTQITGVRGKLTLVSEKTVCASCGGVIEQFQNMFPNVEVTVKSGYTPAQK